MKYLEVSVDISHNPLTGEIWQRGHANVSVGENEVPEQIYKQVREDVWQWMQTPGVKFGQNLSKDQMPVPNIPIPEVQVVKVSNKKEMMDKIRADMMACTSLSKESNGLLSFEALVKNYPDELEETHKFMFKKLTNGL